MYDQYAIVIGFYQNVISIGQSKGKLKYRAEAKVSVEGFIQRWTKPKTKVIACKYGYNFGNRKYNYDPVNIKDRPLLKMDGKIPGELISILYSVYSNGRRTSLKHFQAHLDRYMFIKNGGTYESLMHLITREHIKPDKKD